MYLFRPKTRNQAKKEATPPQTPHPVARITSWPLLSQSDGSTDAADEVRRRQAVLAGSAAAPPPLLQLVLFSLFRPLSRLLLCPILSALGLLPHHLPPLPPFYQPPDQGIHGLGLGAGACGCRISRHEGARGQGTCLATRVRLLLPVFVASSTHSWMSVRSSYAVFCHCDLILFLLRLGRSSSSWRQTRSR